MALAVLVLAPPADDLGDGGEGGLDAALVLDDVVDGLEDLGPIGGRLGEHGLAVLAEADDHRQEAALGREVALVELLDVGVDGLDVLAQPLPFGLEAARGVERPDDQGRSVLQAAEDLDGDPVDRPLHAADVLGAVALDRDGLPQHRRGGHDQLGRLLHVQPGQLGGHARLESGAAETGTPPAVLGAEVIVGASVGAKEPAAAIGAGGSAD